MKRLGLGIDVGGTATRWQLQDSSGSCLAEGSAPGLHGVILDIHQRRRTEEVLSGLLAQALQHGKPTHVVAGITGYSGWTPEGVDDVFKQSITQALPQARCLLLSDVLLSYFCAFEPGQGYMAYAGTGSMSAYLDDDFFLHRVGGRGVVIDDAGGGFWMAKEALKIIWRNSEEDPGSHLRSPLAQTLFQVMGGSEWAHTREYIYTRARGDIGRLSIHIGPCVEHDPIAKQVVVEAGRELARLVRVQLSRHGQRPVVVTGGAAHIHPLYFESLVSALPVNTEVTLARLQAQQHAARLAAQAGEGLWLGMLSASSTAL